ncbi:MAG: aldehyde dehydrogenase family protein [Fibrobacterales bacterium]
MNGFECTNPFSGEVLKKYLFQDFETIKALCSELHKSQKKVSALPITERVQKCRSALTYFKEHADEIGLSITQQMGRPLAQANGEVEAMLDRGNWLCDNAEQILLDDAIEEKQGFYRAIKKEPLGLVFIISAWNYPLLITINGLLTSILCGNTVLLKHAQMTTEIGSHFAKAFNQSFEMEVVRHLIATHEQCADLIKNNIVDHVVFTGSVAGGHAIYQSVAHTFMDCNLELGGKDGVYVDASSDPITAADAIVDGAFYNAGQSCCGLERIYVHHSIALEFTQRCITKAQEYTLGDPIHPSTNMGPMADPKCIPFLEKQIHDAHDKGAQILCGGGYKKIKDGYFWEPTVLVNVTEDMLIMQEENFAPLLPIQEVESIEEAITFLNKSSYGLTASIFTENSNTAEMFASAVEAGTIFQNRCDFLDPALPWTGYKNSGKGSSLSQYGFMYLTKRKAIHFKNGEH